MGSVPEHRYAEFKLAVIGPIVSLGLWALFGLIHNVSSVPELRLFSFWLSNANLALGIFNLLPAFPLDGGRALRSVLAARHGNLKATQSAVRMSKILAWSLGLVGLLTFNLILVLIAFFIHSAAQAEIGTLIAKEALKGLKVVEVMTFLRPIRGSMTLSEAAAEMLKNKVKVLPVEMERKPAMGLLSLETLRSIERHLWDTATVREATEPTTQFLRKDELVIEALTRIAQAPFRALPVVEGDQVNGVLQYSDIMDVIQFRGIQEFPDSEKKAA